MSTQSQIDANRANAQHSTGPLSPDGKQRVAANAVTHGLTSRKILLTGETIEEFESIRRQVETVYHIDPGAENLFVDDAALAWLRLERIAAWEIAVIDSSLRNQEIPAPIARLFGADHDVALNRLHRYERDVRAALRRATAQLREWHKEQVAAQAAAADAAKSAGAVDLRKPVRLPTPEDLAAFADETKPISAEPRPARTDPPDSGR
jgi:hypothetical protein